MSPDTRCKGDSRNKRILCVPGSPHLFISCKKEGMVLKILSLEICISMRKRKKYHLHFKALQVPIPAEIVGIYGTKRPAPDVSDNDVKNLTNSRHLDGIILHLHQFQ